MSDNNRNAEASGSATPYTVHQIGALLALLVVVAWSLAALWLHMVTPAGADLLEITCLGTVAAVSLLLVGLFDLRVRWAYAGGILVALALLVGVAMEALGQNLHFSWSLYNLGVILACAAGLACAYFSARSIGELPPRGWARTVLGIGGIVAAAAVLATALNSKSDLIRETNWQWTLSRIDARLQELETLDERIEFLMAQGAIESAAIGIVVDDTLVWAAAYGEADLDTAYNTGSVTKPFVATAILQLYERGLIDVDGDVNEHLPFSLRHPEFPDTPITFHMLLSHQSGLAHFTDQYMSYHMGPQLANWMAEERGWDLPSFEPVPPLAEFLEGYLTPGGAYYVPEAWIPVRPGSEYNYSTPGYDLLAYLVECVSGQPFVEYARENIFGPLGMDSTSFGVAELSEQVAMPYERFYGVLSKSNVELPLEDVRTIGGGGLFSTVPDMAQFLIAHMNQGQVDGAQLLEPEMVALMHTPAVTFPVGRADLNQVSYGLGVGHVREEPWSAWGHPYDMHGATGHGGSWFGYNGQMWFAEAADGGYGIILLYNTDLDFKADDLWFFASPLRLQVLLMEEAAALHEQARGE
jgi:CubicO group peptidase (beta-lactamase class C family)